MNEDIATALTAAPQPIRLHLNGAWVRHDAAPRTHLGDFVRDHCGLTGTHLGCEHGVCGACTVLVDDQPVRSCITFAVACDQKDVRTIEGLRRRPVDGEAARSLHPRARAAMRLLHAGHAGHRLRHRQAAAGRRRGTHTRRAVGQPVPLHRLRRHRARDRVGAGGPESRTDCWKPGQAVAALSPRSRQVAHACLSAPTESSAAVPAAPATAPAAAPATESRKGWSHTLDTSDS